MRNGRWAWIREQADQPNGLTIEEMSKALGIDKGAARISVRHYQAQASSRLIPVRATGSNVKHYFNTKEQADSFSSRQTPTKVKPVWVSVGSISLSIPRTEAKRLLVKLQELLCE